MAPFESEIESKLYALCVIQDKITRFVEKSPLNDVNMQLLRVLKDQRVEMMREIAREFERLKCAARQGATRGKCELPG